MSKPLLVLDRDGVLNSLIYDSQNGRAPRSLEEIQYFAPQEIIKKLHSKYKIACVTNQPDISNLLIEASLSYTIHHKIMDHYQIQESYLCQHNNSDKCDCRKPRTLLLELAKMNSKNSERPILVGDRWTDIVAAEKMNWKSILFHADGRGLYASSQGIPPSTLKPGFVVDSWDKLAGILL